VLEPLEPPHMRWVLDPFAFLSAALHLAPMPVPDPTTENGRRLFMAHIDGDGFLNRAQRPGRPFSAEVILIGILERFHVPTTVSVIEGEVGAAGLHGDASRALEALARRIFRLPHVELASHSFSHPFDWRKVEAADSPAERLPIPGYRFDLAREIDGSVRYIDERLAPEGKRVRVFLWSGNALPGEEALVRTAALGLANMNGGDTYVSDAWPSLCEVSPLGIQFAHAYQVYAPIGNENMYTGEWTTRFYGYRDAIQTLRRTDEPRRLKPIDIYFHFYAGEKVASLRALEEVYRWALAREPFPVFVSEYAARAAGFQTATVARESDGAWRYERLGALRTLRVDSSLGYPDVERSRGVAGFRDTPSGRYVSLTGEEPAILRLAPGAPSVPYLAWANASIVRWEREGTGVRLRLLGHVPIELGIGGGAAGCTLHLADGTATVGTPHEGALAFQLSVEDTGDSELRCP
jgi:hypothetical protein